jgi:hypothetical protein
MFDRAPNLKPKVELIDESRLAYRVILMFMGTLVLVTAMLWPYGQYVALGLGIVMYAHARGRVSFFSSMTTTSVGGEIIASQLRAAQRRVTLGKYLAIGGAFGVLMHLAAIAMR